MKKILQNPLVLVSIVLILSIFSSIPGFTAVKLGIINNQSIWFYFLISLFSLAFMVGVPLLIIKYLWQEDPKKFGFLWPEYTKKNVYLISITLVISIISIILLSRTSGYANYYATNQQISFFYILQIFLGLMYYISEEFLFRGFFLFSLFEKVGKNSIWISNIVFSILHLNKAPGEMLFSFFFGVMLSYLSLKTKSFVPAALVHFLTALTLNLSIILIN